MSYVNPHWNVFRRDIWLAIDRSGSSRLLYSFSDSLPCVLFHSPFHNTSSISASSSRSISRSIPSVLSRALISFHFFYCAAKLALIGSTSIAVMRKVVGATPMGVNYVHDALYVAASFSSVADKFFVPSFNFNDSFTDTIVSRRLQLFRDNETSLS